MFLKRFVLSCAVLYFLGSFAMPAESKINEVGGKLGITEDFMEENDVNQFEMAGFSWDKRDKLKGQEELISRHRRQLRPVVGNMSSSASPESSQNQTCSERLSCWNNCSTPRQFIQENLLSCFCDNDCTFFKDCCADFDQYCSPKKSEMIDQNSLITSKNKNLWNCFRGVKVTGTNGFWMIGSCPKSWPRNDILFQCTILSVVNTITKDNYLYVPVYTSDGTVYHNRFCAQCNGVNSQDLREYELFFGCPINPPKTTSREKTIDFLFNYCEASNIYWTAPDGAPRRFCLSLEEPYGYGCRRDIDGKCINGSFGIVSIPSKHTNYKNKDCADLCGGSGHYPCGPLTFSGPAGVIPALKPFSIVFDFSNKRKESKVVKVDCPSKHFYDPFLQTCRLGRSPIPQGLFQPNHQEFEVLLWMKSSVPLDFQTRIRIKTTRIDSKTTGEILNIKEQQLSNCEIDVLSSSLFTLKFNLNISLGQNNNKTRSRRSLDIVNNRYVKRMIDFTSPFQLSYFSYNFTVFKVTKRILSCPNLQTYKRNEYMVSSRDGSAVVIIKTKEELNSGNFYTVNDTRPSESAAIFICRDHMFPNCSGKWILRHEGEFVVLENTSIFVNSSSKVFGLSSYVWANHNVYVCEMFSTFYHKQRTPKAMDSYLVISTYVCLVTSIISLVYVLITYSLFTQLRTAPGINLMNLSVSLLLGKMLWLVGSGQTRNTMACTAIAVLLHYCFLVSFVWTSIIAFDTWRAFTARGAHQSTDSKRTRVVHTLKYMVFGWLTPMFYVSFCVILDTTKTFNIGYQTGYSACWMSNPKAILYILAIPVGCILTLNVVFYLLTLKAIKSSTAQARAATNHKDRKGNFWIYIRIASVMGFTWVFGFIAPFGGQFLWYIFVICNCLDGLYIALAFGINQRVRSLYKNRFPIFARFSNSISSDTTKTTSRFEKLPERADTKL